MEAIMRLFGSTGKASTSSSSSSDTIKPKYTELLLARKRVTKKVQDLLVGDANLRAELRQMVAAGHREAAAVRLPGLHDIKAQLLRCQGILANIDKSVMAAEKAELNEISLQVIVDATSVLRSYTERFPPEQIEEARDDYQAVLDEVDEIQREVSRPTTQFARSQIMDEAEMEAELNALALEVDVGEGGDDDRKESKPKMVVNEEKREQQPRPTKVSIKGLDMMSML